MRGALNLEKENQGIYLFISLYDYSFTFLFQEVMRSCHVHMMRFSFNITPLSEISEIMFTQKSGITFHAVNYRRVSKDSPLPPLQNISC